MPWEKPTAQPRAWPHSRSSRRTSHGGSPSRRICANAAGERAAAADLYTLAAAAAANTAERNHLMRSVAPSAWTHLRIELDGTTAEVFVGDATEPDLTVSDLKLGADASGGVGLWVDQGSVATFANLTVTQG
ncbi:MAG: hypothetical protein V9E99_12460 [Microthrixaceae bacterium]